MRATLVLLTLLAATPAAARIEIGPGIVSGRVLGPDGRAVPGAVVALMDLDYGYDIDLWPTTTLARRRCRADGAFRITTHDLGEYRREEDRGRWGFLVAKAPGFLSFSGKFPIHRGEVPLGDIRLLPVIRVSGEVLDDTGERLSRPTATLMISISVRDDGYDRPLRLLRRAHSDKHGRVHSPNLPRSSRVRAEVQVRYPALRPHRQDLGPLNAFRPFRAVLKRGLTLRGRFSPGRGSRRQALPSNSGSRIFVGPSVRSSSGRT